VYSCSSWLISRRRWWPPPLKVQRSSVRWRICRLHTWLSAHWLRWPMEACCSRLLLLLLPAMASPALLPVSLASIHHTHVLFYRSTHHGASSILEKGKVNYSLSFSGSWEPASKFRAKKVKDGRSQLWALAGCSSSLRGPWARKWINHKVCDTWPVRRQTYGHLTRLRVSPPFDRYQVIMLGDRRTQV